MTETESNSPARVLIVEPNMDGHRFNYVRMLCQGCARSGDIPLLLTSPAGATAFRSKVAHELDGLEILAEEPRAGRRFGMRQLRSLVRRTHPRLVVIPDGDTSVVAAAAASLTIPAPLRLLVMRAPSPSAGWRPLLKWLTCAAASRVPGLSIIRLASSLGRPGGGSWVRDPIEYDSTGSCVRLPEQTRWFLIAGALDARKNVPLVLDGLARAQAATDSVLGLALVGRQSPEVARAVAASGCSLPLYTDDRHLTESELDTYIGLADVVVLAHSNEGPSGILGKAARARTRILAAGASSLRSDCDRLGDGAVWTTLDPAALAEGAVKVLQVEPAWSGDPTGTPDEFCAAMLAAPGTRATRRVV